MLPDWLAPFHAVTQPAPAESWLARFIAAQTAQPARRFRITLPWLVIDEIPIEPSLEVRCLALIARVAARIRNRPNE